MMNTTNLFIEILIIGLGGLIAIVLFYYAFSPETSSTLWAQLKSINSAMWVGIAFLVYFEGIVIDRVADFFLRKPEEIIRYGVYKTFDDGHVTSDEDLRMARAQVYYKSPTMTNMLEYGRSRLRIARGWWFNGILICIGLVLILIFRQEEQTQWITGGIWIALSISLLSFWAWRLMVKAEIVKLVSYSKYISSQTAQSK